MTTEQRKNFFNGWDLKTILMIATMVGSFFYNNGKLDSTVMDMKTQRDKDIETVKTIRQSDLDNLNKRLEEMSDMLKEIRDNLKDKKDK